MERDSLQEGKKILCKLFGDDAIDSIAAGLDSKKPGYSDYMFRAYGYFYGDETIDLKCKELIVVACLITQKGATLQLKGHLNGCKKIGLSKKEVAAAITHMTMYVGFPSVVNALLILDGIYSN